MPGSVVRRLTTVTGTDSRSGWNSSRQAALLARAPPSLALRRERIDTHLADPGGKPGDFAGETHPLPHRLLCLTGHHDRRPKESPSLSSTFIGSTTFEAEGMTCAHCRRAVTE
ncbi:hypothetical protein ACWGQ5_33225 [Streptomyces sp. NPDC055722]